MIFNTVGVMLRTDDSRRRTPDDGRWTLDDGRRTMDPAPSTPYYKLTGELKTPKQCYLHDLGLLTN